jgi:catechol 2,3-dioxygenase-like lactoylglutathione lyase family enzyme
MADTSLAAVTYLVRDYDEAIAWFTEKLGFALIEDTPLAGGKRWVLVGSSGSWLLLAKAEGEQQAFIGKAAGGRVAFFLETADFATTFEKFAQAGVHFLEAPRYEAYGTVAVFADLYGNRWDLIEPRRLRGV